MWTLSLSLSKLYISSGGGEFSIYVIVGGQRWRGGPLFGTSLCTSEHQKNVEEEEVCLEEWWTQREKKGEKKPLGGSYLGTGGED